MAIIVIVTAAGRSLVIPLSLNPTSDTMRGGMIPMLLMRTLRFMEITVFTQGLISEEAWIQSQVCLIQMPVSMQCDLGQLTSPSPSACFIR